MVWLLGGLTTAVVLVAGVAIALLARDHEDDVIDELIRAPKYRPGMERSDWQKINRLGARTWHRVLRGQRRDNNVVRFGRT